MIKNDIVLIVLFNHRYDKNLPILEELYKDRFTNRYYLVPFYDGNMPNVIPVYGRSIFFESYIAQGANIFCKNTYKHYLFVADDMILHPGLDENNYKDFFEVKDGQSFIPDLMLLHKTKKFWIGTMSALFYQKKQKYLEIEHEFPSTEEALEKMKQQGLSIRPLSRNELFGEFTLKTNSLANKSRLFLRIATFLRHPFKTNYTLPFPFVGSYSDITLVAADSIDRFVHMCGLFGATGLFAEVAIPTALVLSTHSKIVTEKDTRRKGESFWKNSEAIFWKSEESNENNLKNRFKDLDDLLLRFPDNYIYIHPIKLSQWTKK